jgi:D-alanyl-D-alanine carboxypeptidase
MCGLYPLKQREANPAVKVTRHYSLPVSLLLLWLFFSAAPPLAQTQPAADTARQTEKVDAYVREQMKARSIPGLALAVVRDGKVLLVRSYGLANVELNAPVTDHTAFEIASNSKQFTAGAIMLLVQDGKLSLDDSITRYLHGLPARYSPVTIRHLLNHTSGVKDYIEEFSLNRSLNYTDQELVERIGAHELNFPPGEDARYSTTGYLLLGLVIEKITGKPYGEFLRERIFAPLGMTRTRVIDLSGIIPHRASGYILQGGVLRNGRYVAQTLRASADIGLMTTVLDMVKWDAALSTSKIFTQSSLDAMFVPARLKNGSYAYNAWNGHLGFGWFLDDYYGHREINHGGTLITGFHSNISRFVDKKLAVIVLTNRVQSDPQTIGYTVAGMYDPDLRPPHMLEAQGDDDPQRTQRLKQFLSKASGGEVEAGQTTEGFRARFGADRKIEIAELMKDLRAFSFIGCKSVLNGNVECLGSPVSRLCHYKADAGGKKHFVTFYLTSDERVADLWMYSH